MDLVELLELRLSPAVFVEVRVEEVDPLLSTLDLRAIKTSVFKSLGNSLPFFGAELMVEFS